MLKNLKGVTIFTIKCLRNATVLQLMRGLEAEQVIIPLHNISQTSLLIGMKVFENITTLL